MKENIEPHSNDSIDVSRFFISIYVVFFFLYSFFISSACAAQPKSKILKSFISEDASYNGIALSMADCVAPKNKKESFTLDDKKITWSASIRGGLGDHKTSDYNVYWYAPDGTLFEKQIPKMLFMDCAGLKSSLVVNKDNMKEKQGLWKIEVTYQNYIIDNKYFYLAEADAAQGPAEVPKNEIDLLESKIVRDARIAKSQEEAERIKAEEMRKAEDLAHEEAKDEKYVEPPKEISETPKDLNRLASPGTPNRVGGQSGVQQENLDIKGRGIFVLEPLLVYENAYTEQRYGAVDESTKGVLSKEASSKASEVLTYCGGKPCAVSSVSDSEKSVIAQACYRLQDNSEDLVKQWKDKGAFLQDFALIKSSTKCGLLLVHFVKAKIGSSGSWDFISTGTVIPGTNTTVIKVVLIDINSGKIVWSGSSVERDMPQKPVLIRCLKNVYANFPGYSKK